MVEAGSWGYREESHGCEFMRRRDEDKYINTYSIKQKKKVGSGERRGRDGGAGMQVDGLGYNGKKRCYMSYQ